MPFYGRVCHPFSVLATAAAMNSRRCSSAVAPGISVPGVYRTNEVTSPTLSRTLYVVPTSGARLVFALCRQANASSPTFGALVDCIDMVKA